MDQKAVVRYFSKLSYAEQRVLLSKLTCTVKRPPYSLVFNLDTDGLKKMARCVKYCSNHKIAYKPVTTRGKRKVKFIFEDLSLRNTVLIGQMTLL